MFICPDHFRRIEDRAASQDLLKKSLEFIEIEIHSYCNRTCTFCGNSFIDRRHNRQIMNPALYSKIIDDLATIDYAGVVWYSRYNEPTSDRELFLERLREARAKLPNAKLQTYTNGDYLTPEYIEAIRDAGLNEMRIMAYLTKEEPTTVPNFLNTMVSRLTRLGLPWKFEEYNLVRVEVPGILVTYNFADYLTMGTNRGGALESGYAPVRHSPCTVPVNSIYIDYNGSMVPCCDIRSDYEKHKNCVVYVLTPENSLFDGYANSPLVDWRRSLIDFGAKRFPCNSCSRGIYGDTPEMRDTFGKIGMIAKAVSKLPNEGQKPGE